MTHSQHTPGPWTATETGIYAETINEHGNFYIVTLPLPKESPTATDTANLALIASAPDLAARVEQLEKDKAELVEMLRAGVKREELNNLAFYASGTRKALEKAMSGSREHLTAARSLLSRVEG